MNLTLVITLGFLEEASQFSLKFEVELNPKECHMTECVCVCVCVYKEFENVLDCIKQY